MNQLGELRVFVHTRDDEVIYVSNEARLPKNYNRFCGSIEELFKEKTIKSEEGKVLLRMEHKSIETLLKEVEGEKILLHCRARSELSDFLKHRGEEKDIVAVMGGFPHGDFEKEYTLERFRVGDVELTTWATAMEVLCWYNSAIKR